MMRGQLVSVTRVPAGVEVLSAVAVGAMSIPVLSALDVDEDGGALLLLPDGSTVVVASADHESATVTLADALALPLAQGDWLTVPDSLEVVATVSVDGEPIEGITVPHELRSLLPDRFEQLEDGVTVLFDVDSSGDLSLVDVLDAEPVEVWGDEDGAGVTLGPDGIRIFDLDAATAERYDVLARNRERLDSARARLDAAEQLLDDAFSEIDIKPDQAYVDAAKQQAIDAAAITAQQKADAAKAAAIADAQGKLATARTALETAIASGDAAAIADAEQKVLTAKAEAIAAAAVTAQQKADAAQAAAIAAAASDATAKAAEAMTKAAAALTAAQSAQATADNAIRTYYGPTRPWADGSAQPDDVLGDMWYDDNTGQAYRWNGTAWTVIVDQTIGQALSAAQSAQTTADGKITAFYQPNEPLEGDEGDLWFDTDAGNHVYRRSGTTWVDVADARITAQATALANVQQDITGLEGTLDGKSNVWVQAAQPTGLGATDKGDIWINNGDTPRTTKVWTGTAWIDADSRITQAVTDITKKITTYYTATTAAPSGTFVDGDLWIDSNGKIARRSATAWVTVSDPKALADAALVAAKADATQKADAAREAAKTAAAADATAKSEAAEAAAAATAAADATTKANQAKAAAEAAAKIYADQVSAGEGAGALAAAKADATAKANAAEAAAKAAAALDATAKAEAAQAEAARLAALDATAKANAAQAAAEAASAAVENRALSRGTDLVTNGTGYLKNNYNFSPLTYNGADAPSGATGSFLGVAGVYTLPRTTELIPVDASKRYLFSASARQVGAVPPAGKMLGYTYQIPHDSSGQEITPPMYLFQLGTTTTLAADLRPGDTVMKLVDSSGWFGTPSKPAGASTHYRNAIFWDYVDPSGKAWPPETYSRNTSGRDAWADGSIDPATHVVTLRAPYSGPVHLAGAAVSNSNSAASFAYLAWAGQQPTSEWTKRSYVLTGEASKSRGNALTGNPDTPGAMNFPPGTAAIKIGFLSNYNPTAGCNIAWGAISLSDAAAAQAQADAAAAAVVGVQSSLTGLEGKVDGKANIFVQAAAPTGLVAADKGDIWINNGVTPRIVQVWTGSAWVEADSRTTQAVADIAKKTTTFTTTGTTAPAAPAGGFTAGDLWLDVNGKIARWSGTAWATAVDPKALATEAETSAKAYTTTMVNGLSKGVESTALPGTTVMPKDSVWRQTDSSGKYIAVFTQTAAPQGSSWQVRTIREEVLDGLSLGKLSVSGDATIRQAVINELVGQLASFIKADIGNLTVTGASNLNTVVAERIWGNIASFAELTADKILTGLLHAVLGISTDGAIVAGTQGGARVELTSEGLRVWVIGPNGDPYPLIELVNGKISIRVMGQDGTILGGIGSDGSVTGTKGTFQNDIRIKGQPLLARGGWLDNAPRGVRFRNEGTGTKSIATGVEARNISVSGMLEKGRLYRIKSAIGIMPGVANSGIRTRIRYATGTAYPTTSSPECGPTMTGATYYTGGITITYTNEGFYQPLVDQRVTFLITYQGLGGATPTRFDSSIYIEDVGPATPLAGGADDSGTGAIMYQSTWRATSSRMYNKSGAAITGRDGDIATWFWHGSPTDFQNPAWLYDGGAVISTDSLELGKTMQSALGAGTLHKSEVYVRNKLWLNDQPEGAIALSQLSGVTLPATKTIDATLWVDGVVAGEGVWVEVPTSWFAGGTNRGVAMGDKDGKALNNAGVLTIPGSGVFHGINDADPPLVRHTYSR